MSAGVRGRPFAKGTSGNPGGKPAVAELSAIARRYTADALRALVDVTRFPRTASSLSAITRAGELLLDFGYPGLRKSDGGVGVVDLGELHLIAASRVIPLEPVPDVPDSQLADNMLPAERPLLPNEAGPLWEAAAEREGQFGIELDAALDAATSEGIRGNGAGGLANLDGGSGEVSQGGVPPDPLRRPPPANPVLGPPSDPLALREAYGQKSPGFTDDS